MFVVTYNPKRHLVARPEIYHFLRRQYPELDGESQPELFVYLHLYTRKWVVALWVDKMRESFEEVFVIGPSPEYFPPDRQRQLRRRLRNALDSRILSKKLKDQDDEHWRRLRLDGERDAEGILSGAR